MSFLKWCLFNIFYRVPWSICRFLCHLQSIHDGVPETWDDIEGMMTQTYINHVLYTLCTITVAYLWIFWHIGKLPVNRMQSSFKTLLLNSEFLWLGFRQLRCSLWESLNEGYVKHKILLRSWLAVWLCYTPSTGNLNSILLIIFFYYYAYI